MPHTLVTGANSFVGAHIISKLIEEGHTITGSVRHAAAGDELIKDHPQWKGTLDFVVVEDYAQEGVWDHVFEGREINHVSCRPCRRCTAAAVASLTRWKQIVHVAAPVLDNPANTSYDRDFLRPSVEGHVRALSVEQFESHKLQEFVSTPLREEIRSRAQVHCSDRIDQFAYYRCSRRAQCQYLDQHLLEQHHKRASSRDEKCLHFLLLQQERS